MVNGLSFVGLSALTFLNTSFTLNINELVPSRQLHAQS